MKRAIFLDRDGTINEDVGDLFSQDKLEFIPRAIESLKLLQEQFELFIVTNQSGIGKKHFSEKEYLEFDAYFQELLWQEGIKIEKTYYCPHMREEGCICHKPQTFFLKKAEREYGIDLAKSYVIGDHPHDTEMGDRVGAKSIYLLTGHGPKHRKEIVTSPSYIANDLYEAAMWIMNR